MKTPVAIEIKDCFGPRPEYFIGAPLPKGGLAVYKVPKFTAPETTYVMRVFACRRDRFELLHLETFFNN